MSDLNVSANLRQLSQLSSISNEWHRRRRRRRRNASCAACGCVPLDEADGKVEGVLYAVASATARCPARCSPISRTIACFSSRRADCLWCLLCRLHGFFHFLHCRRVRETSPRGDAPLCVLRYRRTRHPRHRHSHITSRATAAYGVSASGVCWRQRRGRRRRRGRRGALAARRRAAARQLAACRVARATIWNALVRCRPNTRVR